MSSFAASKLSFTEQMRSIGREPGSRHINQQLITATNKIARTLHIQEEDQLFEITRVPWQTMYQFCSRQPACQHQRRTRQRVILSLIFQRYIVIGLTAGVVKG